MKSNLNFVCRSAALAVMALSFNAVWAGDVISTASATVDGLRYRLIDLDPNDGITPALTVNGVWLASVASLGTPQFVSPNWPTSSSFTNTNNTSLLSYDGVIPMQSGSPVSAGLPDGTVSTTASGQSLTVSTQLTTSDLQTGRNPADGTAPYVVTGYNAATGKSGIWTYTQQDQYTSTVGHRDVILAGGAPGTDPSQAAYDNNIPTLNLAVTPHTLLVIDGHSTVNVTADRSNLAQSFQTSSQNYPNSYNLTEGHSQYVYEQSASGYAQAQAYARLSADPALLLPYANVQAGTLSAANAVAGFSYDQSQFYGGTTSASSTDISSSDASSESWTLQLANLSDQDKAMYLALGLTTTLDQSLANTLIATDASFVPDAGPGVVPEPATYALMSLGLVGVLLARRRVQS